MRKYCYSLFILWFLSLPTLAAQSEELVIYSGRSDTFIKPVIKAFTQKTGIKVILHSASSTALLQKLLLEDELTKADLFISNDAGNLHRGGELGLFLPLSMDIVGVIPAKLRAQDNTWVGLSARARVLVVNTNNKLTDFVTSVFDLADPRLQGKLAITHSGNESYIAGVTVYMESQGKAKTQKWLEGMKRNVNNSVYNKHSKIVKAVAAGKKAIGLVNHYYIYRHLDKHPDAPIRILLPDQGKKGMGIAWNVAGIALSRYSQHKVAANKLIKFLVSEQGQKLFAEVNREYPARAGVAEARVIPPRNRFKIAKVPMSVLGKQRKATLDLIDEVGMP